MEGDEGGGLDLMAQIESAIQQIESAGGVVEDGDATANDAGDMAKTVGEAKAEVAPPEPVKAPEPKPDPEVERGLARLVAREAEIAAKEKELERASKLQGDNFVEQREMSGWILDNLDAMPFGAEGTDYMTRLVGRPIEDADQAVIDAVEQDRLERQAAETRKRTASGHGGIK